jgi:hypothetical protein
MAFSVSQSRAEYRRKMAIKNADKKAAKEQNKNKNNYYKPKAITITCRYCKEDGHKVGHFDKALGRFVTTCVKAIEASRRKADYNKRQRQFTSNWKNQVSEAVAEETGSGGWDTAGSKNKVSAAQKTEKPVLKFAKNRFAIDEDSDDETGPTTWSAAAPAGAWSKGAPAKVELTRAPRKTFTPVNSDSSDDDAPPRSILLDKPIEIGNGTWHVFNETQFAKLGLTTDQIDLIFDKKATLTDFIADPQSAADAAFADPAPALERSTGAAPSPHSPVPDAWGDDW